MGAEVGAEWDRLIRFAESSPKAFALYLDQAVAYEADWLAGRVRARIKSGAFTPLKYPRIGHGGTKPLNRTGSLANTVAAVKVGPGRYFVGVKYGRQVEGRDAVQIARVHEFGSTFAVEVTEKMRRFLFGVVFRNLKNKTRTEKGRTKWAAALNSAGNSVVLGGVWVLTITIPPRPFLGPTFDEHLPAARGRIFARFVASIVRHSALFSSHNAAVTKAPR